MVFQSVIMVISIAKNQLVCMWKAWYFCSRKEVRNMPRYCQIGEVRLGSGIAWVAIAWGENELPNISFYATKENRNKVLTDLVPNVIQALIAKGHLNLVIEEVS
jgi:hypothetical protein